MFLLTRTGLFISGIFALLIPEIVFYLLGNHWWPIIWPFRIMTVYTALDPIVMIIFNLLLATGQPQVLRKVTYLQTFFFIPAVLLSAYFFGIRGVAIAADLMLVIALVYLYRPLKRQIDFSLFHIIGWPVFLFVPAIGIAYSIEYFGSVSLVSGFWKSLVFSLIFGLPLVFIEWGSMKEARQFVMGFIRR